MDMSHLFAVLSTFLFPAIGGVTLVATKIASGESRRLAERQFLACLVVVTMVTLHTVVTSDHDWLIHTVTLASMVVGALVLPSQDTSMAI